MSKMIRELEERIVRQVVSDLLAAVRGSWFRAGRILPCPSDLLC